MDDGETSVSNTTGEKYEANNVSVKIPPFGEEKPEIWFFQVEAQFSIANITQYQTKFNYLVAQLEPKVVENIWNIIQSQRNDKYVSAKESTKESEEKSIAKLLTGISLGDMKPSQLLRKMKSLDGTNITDKVLRTLSLGKLPESIKKILAPNLTKPDLLICDSKHNVKHNIATKDPPAFSNARQLDGNKLKLAKQEFKFMLENDIIRPSKSSWASPLHLVSKKVGSLQPCEDYRQLDAQTIPDRYPIPKIEDFHHILKQTKIFSKIDLFKAYFQIPIAEEDKQKTAIITPFGLYEFNVMSFGLRNAPSTFQRFISEVFFGLDFVFAYLDGILVASLREDENSEHLKEIFSRLEQYGLRINVGKRYIKDATKNQAVLHEYLKGTKKKDKSKIPCTKEAKKKIAQSKKDLANATLLSFPNLASSLALFSDASDYAVGSVLQQFEEDSWKPLAFFSKNLTNAQKGYNTYDRELLGIYLFIKQFKHILEERQFTMYTD
ncbi:Transposon Ty3-I Gag-Pol polyprotein [Araneus ventricosus]|uniref:Transposon Ty3-I Gag-Pol polyprotein n=1 Tax=Araneus ventricosus TaxID=182803 RepID=A0A4Y2TRW6_ARAVE|nr:Transposon Ty3-I Gag-Pol polyprotein [Araneus ventricosus]